MKNKKQKVNYFTVGFTFFYSERRKLEYLFKGTKEQAEQFLNEKLDSQEEGIKTQVDRSFKSKSEYRFHIEKVKLYKPKKESKVKVEKIVDYNFVSDITKVLNKKKKIKGQLKDIAKNANFPLDLTTKLLIKNVNSDIKLVESFIEETRRFERGMENLKPKTDYEKFGSAAIVSDDYEETDSVKPKKKRLKNQTRLSPSMSRRLNSLGASFSNFNMISTSKDEMMIRLRDLQFKEVESSYWEEKPDEKNWEATYEALKEELQTKKELNPAKMELTSKQLDKLMEIGITTHRYELSSKVKLYRTLEPMNTEPSIQEINLMDWDSLYEKSLDEFYRLNPPRPAGVTKQD